MTQGDHVLGQSQVPHDTSCSTRALRMRAPLLIVLVLGLFGCGRSHVQARTVFALTADSSAAAELPYSTLRKAYALRNAALAASAYTSDAQLMYQEVAPATGEVYHGTEEIRGSFDQLFRQVDPKKDLDLNFRLESRRREGDHVREAGLYRLRVGKSMTTYGHFDVTRSTDKDGLFITDVSRPATRSDFEELAGPILLAADEEDLDGSYYDALTGRYRLPSGCELVVTRSVIRLFVRDSCTEEWRGLQRASGRHWTAGNHVIPDEAVVDYQFSHPENGQIPTVVVATANGSRHTARRYDRYRTKPTTFRSFDGTTLAGTLFVPVHPTDPRPAAVIVHGSGPQDRHGYASIIDVFADALASAGYVVLTYDKRGVGGSGGEWSRASFSILGRDAAAAGEHVRSQAEVDADRVTFVGSSQAGWVIAKSIQEGAVPAGVFLLGAAGAALTVEEQNLYNTEVRMRCAGHKEAEIEFALAQQQAFFRFLRDSSSDKDLDRLTVEGRRNPRLAEWLFPASSEVDRASGDWFTTLELAFDPLSIWRRYPGKAFFVFSDYDDSTPTATVVKRLQPLTDASPSRLHLTVLDGSQHLGLVADNVCASELNELTRFNPGLFKALAAFTKAVDRPD